MKLTTKPFAGRFARCYLVFVIIMLPGYSVATTDNQRSAAIQALIKRINTTLSSPSPSPSPSAANTVTEQDVTTLNPENDSDDRFSPGTELILSIYLEQIYLGDLFVIKNRTNARLEFDTLMQLLEFPIERESATGSIAGWYITNANQFELRYENQRVKSVVSGQQPQPITSEDYQWMSEDLFVDADRIADWFGLTFEFDFGQLRLTIKSQQKLPIQARLARSKRSFSTRQQSLKPILPPRAMMDYQALSAQVFDVQVSATQRESDNGSTTSHNYSVLGAQDLGYFNSQFFISGGEYINSASATFQRNWRYDKSDSGLALTELQFGDVFATNVGGGGTGGRKLGLSLSNRALYQTDNFQTRNFTGVIEPGWDVELYRNGVLINQQLNVENGQYEFIDVPLLYGNNDFQLIFYGPQGQVRTEEKSVLLDSSTVRSGPALNYQLSVSDLNRGLLSDLIDTGTGFEIDSSDLGYRVAGSYSARLGRGISIRAGHDNMIGGEIESERYSVGATATAFDRAIVGLDYSVTSKQTSRLRSSLNTYLGNQAINVDYTRTEQLTPGFGDSANDILTENASMTIAGPVLRSRNVNLSHLTRVRQFNDVKGLESYEFNNLMNLRFFNTSLTHSMRTVVNEGNQLSDQGILGSVGVQRRLGPLFTRLSARYQTEAQERWQGGSVSLSYPFAPGWRSQLEIDYNKRLDSTSINLQTSLQKPSYMLTARFGANDRDQFSVGVTARFSFGVSDKNELFFTKRAMAMQGTLLVRVFHDRNNNGIFDANDVAMPKVKVKAVQHNQTVESDDKGLAVLAGLSAFTPSDIKIERESLEDPYMIPAFEGRAITLRPGVIDSLDFPLVYSSEIDGTVAIHDVGGNDITLANATVELVDQQGNVVETTQTEYDGYYNFALVKPGAYSLRMSPEYLARRSLISAGESVLSVDNQGNLFSGEDLDVYRADERGYLVTLGRFKNSSMVKLFWSVIQAKLSSIETLQPFHFYDRINQQYVLQGGYFKNERDAIALCELILANGSHCEVNRLSVN